MNNLCLFFTIFMVSLWANASLPNNFKSLDLLTNKPTLLNTSNTEGKGTILVFLSSKCPCSNSHISILKKLSAKYKNYKFIGVHSNADESLADAQKYFKKAALGFQVLQDNDTQIAEALQAFKTPHAFILNPKGEILYQGGVTNSSHADSADQIFLEQVLSDLEAGKAPRITEGRTLGCVILRKSEITK